MKIFTASAIILTAFLVAWTRHRVNEWEAWVDDLNDGLVHQPIRHGPNDDRTLPPVVQKYFQAIFPKSLSSSSSSSSVVHSVNIHQEGHFMFASSWVPFEAQQIVLAVAPSFVWDATISMTPIFQKKDLQQSLFPTMQVCDALVNDGKRAYLRAALVNVFDAIDAKSTIEEDDDDSSDEDPYLWVGEAMRWLAEAIVVPTSLLPEVGLVQWNEVPGRDHQAVLSLKDPRMLSSSTSTPSKNRHVQAVRLMVEFDLETGYITQVSGMRPYEREILDERWDMFPLFTRKHTSWEWRQWIGRVSEYAIVADGLMIVPQRLEAGWMNDDGEVEWYFKGFNEATDYTMTIATTEITSYLTPRVSDAKEQQDKTADGTTAVA